MRLSNRVAALPALPTASPNPPYTCLGKGSFWLLIRQHLVCCRRVAALLRVGNRTLRDPPSANDMPLPLRVPAGLRHRLRAPLLEHVPERPRLRPNAAQGQELPERRAVEVDETLVR